MYLVSLLSEVSLHNLNIFNLNKYVHLLKYSTRLNFISTFVLAASNPMTEADQENDVQVATTTQISNEKCHQMVLFAN